MDVITHQTTQEVDFHGEVMLIVILVFMIYMVNTVLLNMVGVGVK